MKILAIDTTSESAGIALKTGNGIRGRSFSASGNHGRNLFPAVQEVLDESGVSIHDIDRIGCCVGPGSYTGIRITVTACTVLSRMCGPDIGAVTSLEALAWTARSEHGDAATYAPLISAGNNICFHGVYSFDQHGPVCLSEPKRCDTDDILAATPSDAVFTALSRENWHPAGTVILPDKKKNLAYATAEITAALPPQRRVGYADVYPVYLRDASITSRIKGKRPYGK